MDKKKEYITPECLPATFDEALTLCLTGSVTNQDYDETDYVWEG